MASKKYEFAISRRAEREFHGIIQYLIDEFASPQAANRFYKSVQKAYGKIKKFPYMGPPIGKLYMDCSEYRKFVLSSYNIYYIILDNTVTIVSIMHQSRSTDNLK